MHFGYPLPPEGGPISILSAKENPLQEAGVPGDQLVRLFFVVLILDLTSGMPIFFVWKRCGFALLLALGLALTAHAQTPTRFRLLPASQTRVAFANTIDETEKLNVLAYEYFFNGGGVAIGDFNNDGLEDVFLTANMKPNRLYLNTGNLTFRDITDAASPALGGRAGGWKTGVSVADVNNDGWLDLYVCYSGKGDEAGRRNQLFINQGATAGKGAPVRFVEQAADYGLDDPGYATQAVFFDFDRDGDLDCFLLNHNVKKYDNLELARLHRETDPLAGNKLFENRDGRFVNVSAGAGIHQYPLTFGLGVVVADVNLDGWPDLYVTNDYNEPDYLYVNQRNGSFRDETQRHFRHLPQFSMGVDIADYNNDGLPDVMSLDMLPEDNRRQKLLQLQENYESFELMQQQGLGRQYMRNMLQLNNGDGTFSEIAQLAGVSNTDWSWSPLLADYDNDGHKDLFVTNGYLRDYTNKDFLRYWGDYKLRKAVDREPVQLMDLVRAMPATKIPNYIFRNNGDLTFRNQQRAWGFATPSVSGGAAYADLDNDGDLDLVVNNLNAPAFVYQNLTREQEGTAYLQLRLVPRRGHRQALGTSVRVYAGGTMQYLEHYPVRGYLSTQSWVLHIGLGGIPLGTAARADSVVLTWPDGSVQRLRGVPVNQRLVVEQPEGVPAATVPGTPVAAAKPVFRRAMLRLPYAHEPLAENDFKRQPLLLWMYSHAGPVLAKGDVNRDGRDDLFISGDAQKPGTVWVQGIDGAFTPMDDLSIGDEATSTVAAALFFDANGDGFDDLYVAKGGYALHEPNTPALQDELYLNDGRGHLRRAPDALPDLTASSKACVRAADYDGDGDLDLFVGGRVVPGRYPETPRSYLLTNDGRGTFRPTEVPFAEVGLVTDAQWADLTGDGRPDLVLCGEFLPVTIYANTPTGFVDRTADLLPGAEPGFWHSLALADLNGDGKLDLVAGNLGLNSQLRFSKNEPAELLYADFDDNGSVDPFFCFPIQGTLYPFVSRDELNDQIYAMRRRFAYYRDYADATAERIFTPAELGKARRRTVTEARTLCYLSEGGRYVRRELPLQAQFAPVTVPLCGDFTGDGKPDLLLLGNQSDNRLKLGSMDANYGCLLAGDGQGNFTYVPQPAAGLSVVGDVKAALAITIQSVPHWLIGSFNQPLQLYTRTP
jgi:hypothetical protein